MDKQKLFLQATSMEEQLGKLYKDIGGLKEKVIHLLEENKNLTIENQHLRAELEKLRTASESMELQKEEERQKPPIGEGYDNLARLYQEGFHICNVHFGSLRTEGDCLFCLSFLSK